MIFRKGTLAFLIFTALSQSTSGFEFDFQDKEPVYISPTRLQQSPHDTPASVSRIDHETIKYLQADTIPDLLRHVAGMIITDKAGNNSQVNVSGPQSTD